MGTYSMNKLLVSVCSNDQPTYVESTVCQYASVNAFL